MKVTHDDLYYLGIDGGGSKCRARLVDYNNQILGQGLSGPANPVAGVEQAINSIEDAIEQAFFQAGLGQGGLKSTVAGIGLAGINLPNARAMFKTWKSPFRETYLTSDLHVACIGAHAGGDGAVVIIGTGSCGLADVNNVQREIGGYGFQNGDKGSGAWFGQKAVKYLLESLDGIEKFSELSKRLIAKLECEDAISVANKMTLATPSSYAKLAPLVFEAAEKNDKFAKKLVDDGAGYISQMILRLVELNPPRLSILGGLAPRLKPYLDAEVVKYIEDPLGDAETGAILFALKKWKENKTHKEKK